jgi:hypothetical protein
MAAGEQLPWCSRRATATGAHDRPAQYGGHAFFVENYHVAMRQRLLSGESTRRWAHPMACDGAIDVYTACTAAIGG